MTGPGRWAVVGAGWAGIAVARALRAVGVQAELLDRRDRPGGLWTDQVYEGLTLLTPRQANALQGAPLPDGPPFPTAGELLDYLQRLAAGLPFRGGTTVREVVPDGDGWSVDGRLYEGVVLATGMFTQAWVPDLPGTLSVPALHTRDYRSVRQLGQRVLVVGLGNSGADVAQQAAASGRQVELAVGQARHVVPRAVLGRPVVSMRRPALLPDALVRLGLDPAVRLGQALASRGRLPSPASLVLEQSPVVHSRISALVGSGAVGVRPGVRALEGERVRFSDGSTAEVDTVVWATGYRYALPVARARLDGGAGAWAQQPPLLVGGAWSPVSRALAAVGHREPRHGRGPYLSAVARLVAAGALAQRRLAGPVGRALGEPPDDAVLVDDVRELPRLRRLAERARSLPTG